MSVMIAAISSMEKPGSLLFTSLLIVEALVIALGDKMNGYIEDVCNHSAI